MSVNIASKRYIYIQVYVAGSAGNGNYGITFNNSTSSYDMFGEANGSGVANNTGFSYARINGGVTSGVTFSNIQVQNIQSVKKFIQLESYHNDGSHRYSDFKGFWNNTTDLISSVQVTHSGSNDFNAGSYIYVYGTDGDIEEITAGGSETVNNYYDPLATEQANLFRGLIVFLITMFGIWYYFLIKYKKNG